ncbi:MAG: nucleotide-binding universal stress UspA family protein [Pseudorhodobacter sp.]|jgi:nucleotide-binding universal stress UspA family protein
MAYKSLLTVCTDRVRASETFAAAAEIALLQDAHLDALALGVDKMQVGYAYMGTDVTMLSVAQDHAKAEAAAVESAITQKAAALPDMLHWSAEAAVAMMGSVVDLVALRARFADLVILGQPYGDGKGPEEAAIVEAALFEGQAPVLILPNHPIDGTGFGKRIIVAWDQSREAMTAVRKALPLLKKADLVSITIIDPPQHGPERSDPGGVLCQMLVRHGVRAKVTVLARTMPQISDVLARQTRDFNADLLVMGAYGHSRFREAIMGGATRNMLEQAEIPVFLAH